VLTYMQVTSYTYITSTYATFKLNPLLS